MVYIKTNLRNFSPYTLTSFFYTIKPKRIWFNGNVILIEAEREPYNFNNWKIIIIFMYLVGIIFNLLIGEKNKKWYNQTN
jgi:hypothetical protein